MIDVQAALEKIPHSETFCSVEKLHELVHGLQAQPRFEVTVAGGSVNGIPIHHVRFGQGTVKALIVAGPHCMEPIGSLTVFGLLTLLQHANRALMAADVEWHIVPCIDPDGALLNEGWTQKPFTLENHMRNFYVQPLQDGVDTSFPVTYKRLSMLNSPSQEAVVLKGLLEQIRPDFYFPLHSTFAGGAFYYMNRDLGQPCYRRIYQLLEQNGLPVRTRPQYSEFLATFSPGIVEMYSVRKHYDFYEKSMSSPQEHFLKQGYGAASWDHLEQIKPDALTFVAEMGHFQHPSYESPRSTGQNLRQFKLRVDADSKYLATVMLEEWEKVKDDVDSTSPFYRAMVGLALPTRERIYEGGWPVSRYPTQDTLFNPQYDRTMTEGEKFDVCVVNNGLKYLAYDYQFVRLLKASRQTPAVEQAIAKLERVIGDAFVDVQRYFDLGAIEVFGCDALTRVQLGSGLIALNALLEQRASQH
jgi:hypothetical protein